MTSVPQWSKVEYATPIPERPEALISHVRELGSRRPPPRPWRAPKRPSLARRIAPGLIGVSVIGLAAVAGYFALWAGRTLRVEANDGAALPASVQVDGVERCSALPCTVEDVAAGPRRVRVSAPGFVPSEITLSMAQREHRRLSVALEREGHSTGP